jgi:hypothetical protein
MAVGFEQGHLKKRLSLVYSVSTSLVIFMLEAEIEFAFLVFWQYAPCVSRL